MKPWLPFWLDCFFILCRNIRKRKNMERKGKRNSIIAFCVNNQSLQRHITLHDWRSDVIDVIIRIPMNLWSERIKRRNRWKEKGIISAKIRRNGIFDSKHLIFIWLSCFKWHDYWSLISFAWFESWHLRPLISSSLTFSFGWFIFVCFRACLCVNRFNCKSQNI